MKSFLGLSCRLSRNAGTVGAVPKEQIPSSSDVGRIVFTADGDDDITGLDEAIGLFIPQVQPSEPPLSSTRASVSSHCLYFS